MCFNDIASGLVVHWRFQILNERSAAPHIQGLRTVADGEDWFAMVERVLQKEFVRG